MTTLTAGDRFVAWAERERSIAAVVLIGSQVRSVSAADYADQYSDWDFQVITARPDIFDNAEWLRPAALGGPIAYVLREGRLGSARKVSILIDGGELDLVILPSSKLQMLRWFELLGLSSRVPAATAALIDLATVLRRGYRFSKGERTWGPFFARVTGTHYVARLTDADVVRLAEGFVCDYVSTRRKLARGEMLAAQRWLHYNLAETNFRLLQELRRRRGHPSHHDARRLEQICTEEELDAVTVVAAPCSDSLGAALDKSANTCRSLVQKLVDKDWRWPRQVL